LDLSDSFIFVIFIRNGKILIKTKMKKLIALYAVLAILGTLFIASPALATDIRNGELLTVEDVLIEDDLYLIGGTTTVTSQVKGDLIVVAGEVEIDGNIEGDLFILGGNIVLNGLVSDDVRIGGGYVTINGKIGDDLIMAGGEVTCSANSAVAGNVYGAAGSANFKGSLTNLYIAAGTLFIGGNITGNVDLLASDYFKIDSSAKIGGNLAYAYKENAEIPDGVVTGTVTVKESQFLNTEEIKEEVGGFGANMHLGMKFFSYLALLFLGVIVLLAFPYSFRKYTELGKKSYGNAIFYGLLLLIGLPVVSVLLILTVVGYKVIFILWLGLLIMWPFAKIFVSYFIGSLILKPGKDVAFWGDFGRMAFGMLILFVACAIPVIGILINIITVVFGLGGLVLYKKESIKVLRGKKMA